MKHRVIYAVAIAALLLVGAGCAKPTTPKVTGLPTPQAPTSKAPAVDTPSGAAAAIISDADIEAGIYDEDSDTADTKAGTKEVTDFTDTTYDVSQ